MGQELVDLETLKPALQQFVESPSPEDGLIVILQHPQLLTQFVDTLFVSLIDDARSEGNDKLTKFYRGRLMLLQAVKHALSNKDTTLLHLAKLILSKTEDSKKNLSTEAVNEWFDFQDIIVKTFVWLKAPTLEQGVKILHHYPELLTDKPIRMLSFLMEEAQNHGDEMFVHVLKTLREFLQTMRLNLIDKKSAMATTEEIKNAVKQALTETDFSSFTNSREFSFLA